ncbi:MAG: Sua5/YciO/YrdC/YwlC family protein, partial [Candidatus Macondimonas sp.]
AKPLAVMFTDLAQLRRSCDVSMAEAALLQSALAPIVLLARRAGDPLCAALAPGLDRLGALLPYSPLHHLLLETLGFPVVATSANRSGAPLCFDNDHALTALQGIAEGFLLHDRPIVRPVEDSVAQVFEGETMMLRLGRGRVPEELRLPRPVMPVLGVGGQWKNGLAVTVADRLVVGGYRGDLDHPEAQTAWAQECMTLPALFGLAPQRLACDLHPDYVPTRLATAQAEREGLALIAVQHHHAHLAAAVLEAALPDPLLGVVWDGTGLGTDRTVWGGELLAWEAGRARRVGTLIPFQLPGGDAAMGDPRRTALGVLAALGEPLDGAWASRLGFEVQTLRGLGRMLETGTACVTTTSAGRLFDAMAALLGRTDPVTYEGEAAMALETLARSWRRAAAPYAVSCVADRAGLIHMDWRMALRAALADRQAGKSTAAIAARWHLSLAALIAQAVARLDMKTVVLTGGCFQNTLLLGHTLRLLRGQGRRVFWPQRLPVNDGGLAAGQAALAAGVWEEG